MKINKYYKEYAKLKKQYLVLKGGQNNDCDCKNRIQSGRSVTINLNPLNNTVREDNLDISQLSYGSIKDFDWSVFDYPIESYHNGDGCWRFGEVIDFNRELVNKDNEKMEIDNKIVLDKKNYDRIYYYQKGENDKDPWIYVVHHKDGYYVFFWASCDYTGFDCQGGGEILYSKDPKVLWNFGLNDYSRYKILLNKVKL